MDVNVEDEISARLHCVSSCLFTWMVWLVGSSAMFSREVLQLYFPEKKIQKREALEQQEQLKSNNHYLFLLHTMHHRLSFQNASLFKASILFSAWSTRCEEKRENAKRV